MKVVLQVSTGSFGRCTAEDAKTVERRLEELMKRLPVKAVIYGWGRREGLFEVIAGAARRHGAEAWLWLPAFADVRDPEQADPMVFPEEEGQSEVSTCEGEEFRFVCPGSEKNRRAVFDAFDSLTEGCRPDGVFLDRIRYPSAVFSPVHFFGCGCEKCLERQRRAGIDVQRLREKIGAEKGLGWCAPESLENGRYHYRDPDLEALAGLKRQTVTDAVAFFSREFRAGGLKVGIDVFAPALADLVGQDLKALLPHVDFIKPMMYFRTFAPAGIPCELQGYGGEISSRLSELWGTDVGRNGSMEAQLRGFGASEREGELSLPGTAEVKEELHSAGTAAGKICPGIEVNRIPGICEPDGTGFRHAVRAAEAAGCDTLVLSWNVLKAREEELRQLEACL